MAAAAAPRSLSARPFPPLLSDRMLFTQRSSRGCNVASLLTRAGRRLSGCPATHEPARNGLWTARTAFHASQYEQHCKPAQATRDRAAHHAGGPRQVGNLAMAPSQRLACVCLPTISVMKLLLLCGNKLPGPCEAATHARLPRSRRIRSAGTAETHFKPSSYKLHVVQRYTTAEGGASGTPATAATRTHTQHPPDPRCC